AILIAVGYSTESVSARLPGTSAPAAIGLSARLGWAGAGALPARPSSSSKETATPRENRLFMALVRFGKRGLQERLGTARSIDAHADSIDCCGRWRERRVVVRRAAGGQAGRLNAIDNVSGASA